MLDLSSLDASVVSETGSIMELRHPSSGEVLQYDAVEGQKPVTLTLAGEDSEAYRRATHKSQNRRFAKGNISKIKAEELENDMVELHAACTLAWSGIVVDGQELNCTKANAMMLYRRFRWIADQVSDFIRDRSNFLPPSQTA